MCVREKEREEKDERGLEAVHRWGPSCSWVCSGFAFVRVVLLAGPVGTLVN